MIHVAIVEDEEIEHTRLRECLDFVAQREKIRFEISDFYSATSFLCDYRPIYDVVLMDIDMPEMNGIEAAKKLRKNCASSTKPSYCCLSRTWRNTL